MWGVGYGVWGVRSGGSPEQVAHVIIANIIILVLLVILLTVILIIVILILLFLSSLLSFPLRLSSA